MFNVYKNQPSRKTGGRNLMGPKTLPTIWGAYMKLVTKYRISAINSCWEKCDEKWAYMGPKNASHNMGIPIWSLWPNIRFLQSIFAEKNAMKNEHICSMCIKINKVGKQEVGIRWTKNASHDMGYLYEACDQISDLCHQQLLEKNATKNILDGRTEIKQYTSLPLRGAGG